MLITSALSQFCILVSRCVFFNSKSASDFRSEAYSNNTGDFSSTLIHLPPGPQRQGQPPAPAPEQFVGIASATEPHPARAPSARSRDMPRHSDGKSRSEGKSDSGNDQQRGKRGGLTRQMIDGSAGCNTVKRDTTTKGRTKWRRGPRSAHSLATAGRTKL